MSKSAEYYRPDDYADWTSAYEGDLASLPAADETEGSDSQGHGFSIHDARPQYDGFGPEDFED